MMILASASASTDLLIAFIAGQALGITIIALVMILIVRIGMSNAKR